MASYNTLQAITDLASGLSETTYPAAALPYIKTLKLLFTDLETELEQEKAAPTGETVEAAKETIPPVLSSNGEKLSSPYRIGQEVHTPDGYSTLIDYTDEFVMVRLPNGRWKSYVISDVTPF